MITDGNARIGFMDDRIISYVVTVKPDTDLHRGRLHVTLM
jgi:hypothetical protein